MGKVAYLLIASIFVLGITINSENAIAQQVSIPNWVKTIALWWGQGKISDSEFIKAIQYLINQKILVAPYTSQANFTNQTNPLTQPVKPQAPTPTNPLSPYLPTQSDLGPQWSAQGQATTSKYLTSKGAQKTIEQIYVKTTIEPNTVATVDIGAFISGSSAGSVFSENAAYWKQQRFTQWQLQSGTSTPPCIGIARSSLQGTAINLVCVVGKTVIQIDVSGNSIAIDNDMDILANSILKKIPLNLVLQ